MIHIIKHAWSRLESKLRIKARIKKKYWRSMEMQTGDHAMWHFMNSRYAEYQMVSLAIDIGLPKDVKILEFGCATGRVLNAFREFGYENLSGCDINEVAISHMKKKSYYKEEEFFVCDLFYKNKKLKEYEFYLAKGVLFNLDSKSVRIISDYAKNAKYGIMIFEAVDYGSFRHDYDQIFQERGLVRIKAIDFPRDNGTKRLAVYCRDEFIIKNYSPRPSK